MEKFYFEVPTINRKKDALEFIQEFFDYSSNVYGAGSLKRYLDNYEGWLEKLKDDAVREIDEEHVPALTYFFVRESDKRIVGMINIRLALNEKLKRYGGNIGYCIRPTERNKGYNKINLYLALKVSDAHNIKEVLLDADLNNPASWKTMEALGGVRIKEYFDDEFIHNTIVIYTIDVKKALTEHQKYQQFLSNLEIR